MAVDPELQGLLDLLAATETPPLDGPGAAPAIRESYDMMMTMLGVGPASVIVEDRDIPGPAGDLAVRIYRPVGVERPGVLVYFHGGGFVIGNIGDSDRECRLIADEARCAVVSVEYRLAPEHPYPAAPEDCSAAVQWVAAHADELALDVSRLAVGGDSAGGNLAAGVAQRAREAGGPAIVFQLLVYPVTDMRVPPTESPYESMHTNAEGYFLEAATMDWFEACYLPDRARGSEVEASPILAVSLAGLPPALVLTCQFDPLRDQGEAYAKALADAGVQVTLSRYDGGIHGMFSMALTTGIGRRFMDEITAALRSALGVIGAARVVAGMLAAALVWAAVAKAVSLEATADAFGSLGLRQPGPLSIAVPLAELACAVALIVAPVVGATAALFLLVAFTAVLVSVIHRGVPLGCACFGAVSNASERPVSWGSVIRNGVLIALALFVIAVGPGLI